MTLFFISCDFSKLSSEFDLSKLKEEASSKATQTDVLRCNCKYHQRRFRKVFARMVIEQVKKLREKHQCVRFILSTGMQQREETPRENSAENAPARKLVFFELNSLAIMDLARERVKGYIPRWSKILVCEIMVTDLKTASLCFTKHATDKFV